MYNILLDLNILYTDTEKIMSLQPMNGPIYQILGKFLLGIDYVRNLLKKYMNLIHANTTSDLEIPHQELIIIIGATLLDINVSDPRLWEVVMLSEAKLLTWSSKTVKLNDNFEDYRQYLASQLELISLRQKELKESFGSFEKVIHMIINFYKPLDDVVYFIKLHTFTLSEIAEEKLKKLRALKDDYNKAFNRYDDLFYETKVNSLIAVEDDPTPIEEK